MNFELFLHGVPVGHKMFGLKEDFNYFEKFYKNSNEAVKLLIQIRNSVSGKAYCYYNYLVYNNVISNVNRPGSYFGITIRTDTYCYDYDNMYRILDLIYNSYIIGNILEPNGDNARYVISDFEQAEPLFMEIEQVLINLLSKRNEAVNNLSLSIFTAQGATPQMNLYDASRETILSHVKKSGSIVISPYFQSLTEIKSRNYWESQICQIKQQCEQQISSANSTQQSNKQQISQLNSTIAQRESDITNLKSKVKSLENDIAKLGKQKDIPQLVSQIKDPINKLASILGELTPAPASAPEAPTKNPNKRNNPSTNFEITINMKTLKFIGSFIAIIIIACLMWWLYPSDDSKKTGGESAGQVAGNHGPADTDSITESNTTTVTNPDLQILLKYFDINMAEDHSAFLDKYSTLTKNIGYMLSIKKDAKTSKLYSVKMIATKGANLSTVEENDEKIGYSLTLSEDLCSFDFTEPDKNSPTKITLYTHE